MSGHFPLEVGTEPAQSSSPMALESEPSVVPSIFLSDNSIIEQGTQKRSLIGCFDQFSFPQFPAKYPRFFITVWVTNIGGALTHIDLTTRIQEHDSAHVVFSSSIKAELTEERKFERDQILAFSIPVPGITFPTPGSYTVLILLNGEEAGKRDIKVLQVAK